MPDSPYPKSRALPPVEEPTIAAARPTQSENDLHTSAPEAAAIADEEPVLKLDSLLGGYRLLKQLGAGGMGAVFLAEDVKLQRKIALKVMKPEVAAKSTSKDRFLREARAAARIEHDHIIPILGIGEDQGIPFIAMPFLKGEPLDARLKRSRLSVAEIVQIGRQTAEALDAAHQQGMIHRDIKPANIWLEEHDKNAAFRVKILDFGLARLASDEGHLTQSGAIMGTPSYMAPEQARGRPVDHRADLFSLGVVLYEMSTGKRPFTGPDTMAILSSLALDVPPAPLSLNPELPPILSNLIVRLLDKEPGQRIQTAKDVAEVLRRLQLESTIVVVASSAKRDEPSPWTGLDASSTEMVPSPNAERGMRKGALTPKAELQAPTRIRPLWIGAGAVVALLIAIGVFFATRPKNATKEGELAVAQPKKVEIPLRTEAERKATVAPPTAFEPRTIDLLTCIEPAKDRRKGEWKFEGKELVGQGVAAGSSLCQIPYQPPTEYDLVVEFTRLTEDQSWSMLFAEDLLWRQWVIAQGGNSFGPFGSGTLLRGARFKLENGKRYSVRFAVRKNAITGVFDDQRDATITALRDDIGHLIQIKPSTPSILGLVTYTSDFQFHRITLTEISGPGTFLRSASEVLDPEREAAVALHPFSLMDLRPASKKMIYCYAKDALPTEPFEITRIVFATDTRSPNETEWKELLPKVASLRALRVFASYNDKFRLPAEDLLRLSESPFGQTADTLTLPNTNLSTKLLDALKRFPNLKQLACKMDKADDELLSGFKDLSSLENLSLHYLENATITQKGVAAVTGLPLKSLELSISGPLKREWGRGIAAMKQLETLKVHYCDDNDLANLASCPKLQNLKLNNYSVTKDGLLRLKALPFLRAIEIEKTKEAPLTEADVNQLADALPRCQIKWSGGVVGPKDKNAPLPTPDP